MTYLQLAYLHLATVVPAFFIATFLLIKRKGTPLHKMLRRVYMLLMLVTAVIVLFMPAHVGPKWLGHFGFIHLFSLLTFNSVFRAYTAIRQGNIKAHRGHMVGLYIGGLLIAGAFAFSPGRMLYQWLFH